MPFSSVADTAAGYMTSIHAIDNPNRCGEASGIHNEADRPDKDGLSIRRPMTTR